MTPFVMRILVHYCYESCSFLEYRLVLKIYHLCAFKLLPEKGVIILVGSGSNPILKSTATEAFQMAKMILLKAILFALKTKNRLFRLP